MAGTTWALLTNNELVCHDEVVNAVAGGALKWSGSNPGLAGGYCYTRADYAAYIDHDATALGASGIASNELMSKAQMVAYRILLSISATITGEEYTNFGGDWGGRVQYNVGTGTNSVVIEGSVDGGGYSTLATTNVTPGSTALTSPYQEAPHSATSVRIRITPYSSSGGGGTAGTAVEGNIYNIL